MHHLRGLVEIMDKQGHDENYANQNEIEMPHEIQNII